ncbi:MAG: hypothetical protein V2B20_00450 [Pseudomonadota bacterium]
MKINSFRNSIITNMLLIASVNLAFASDYAIVEDGKKYECSNFSVENDSIKCSHDKAMFIYKKTEIDKILYKNQTIYPYSYDENKILFSLKKRECNDIISSLYGPLYIDKLEKANMYLGVMYDRGICVSKSLTKALEYYKLSKLSDTPLLSSRVSEINHLLKVEKEAEIQMIENRRIEEAKLKKIEQERIAAQRRKEIEKEIEHQKDLKLLKAKEDNLRPICEKDCIVNKYQYDTSCFKACMHHHGAWWFGTGLLEE